MSEIEELCHAEQIDYAREQRKYILKHYEKFTKTIEQIPLNQYIEKVYIPTLANNFHNEYMKKHREQQTTLASGWLK